MGTHKTPVAKKSAKKRTHEAAQGIKRPDSSASHLPAEPPPVPKPAFDFMKERTLSVKEVAYRMGKSEDSILQWLHQGRLKGWQIGGPCCRVLVSEDSVLEMLVNGTTRFGE